jgi:hypothetical protein
MAVAAAAGTILSHIPLLGLILASLLWLGALAALVWLAARVVRGFQLLDRSAPIPNVESFWID